MYRRPEHSTWKSEQVWAAPNGYRWQPAPRASHDMWGWGFLNYCRAFTASLAPGKQQRFWVHFYWQDFWVPRRPGPVSCDLLLLLLQWGVCPLGWKSWALMAWMPLWYCSVVGHAPAEMEKDSNLMEKLRIAVLSMCWIINYPETWLGFWHVESRKLVCTEQGEWVL